MSRFCAYPSDRSTRRTTIWPLRSRGGILLKLAAFLVVVVAVTALVWMLFLPALISYQVRTRTGFDATIAQLACNPFAGTIELKDFVLTNPPTFPVKDFVQLKHFSAKAERGSFMGNPMVFETMDLELGNVTLIKRSDGVTNSAAFERNLEEFDRPQPRPPSSKPPRDYLVRKLRIRISQLTVVDFVRGEQRKRVYKLDLDQAYVDVNNLHQLVDSKAFAALEPVALVARDLLPSGLRAAVEEVLKPAEALLRERASDVGARANGFFDALEESKKP